MDEPPIQKKSHLGDTEARMCAGMGEGHRGECWKCKQLMTMCSPGQVWHGLFESLTVLWRETASGEHTASESYFCYCL